MLRLSDIQPDIIEMAASVTEERPDFESQMLSLSGHFFRRYSGFEANEIADLFDLCDRLDRDRRFKRIRDSEVEAVVDGARASLLETFVDTFYDVEAAGLKHGDRDGVKEVRRKRNLAHLVRELVFLAKSKGAELSGFGVKWLQMENADLYSRVRQKLLKKGGSGLPDWEEVKSMLPESLRGQFEIDVNISEEKTLIAAAKEYEYIAKQLGPEVVAEFLISTGRISQDNFQSSVKVLRTYIGDGMTPLIGFGEAVQYPEAFLEVTSIRRLLFVKLRNYVYQELIAGGYDSASEAIHRQRLGILKGQVAGLLSRKMKSGVAAHEALFAEVMDYFEEVLGIESPERMVTTLDVGGEPVLFPSLRQKIAMKEMKESRRQLISFFMSKGKTAAAYLSKEFVGAKKMLFVCPQGKLVEEMEERVEKYYKAGDVPTVGKIESGMSYERLQEVLACEVVVFPYTMLKSEIDVPLEGGGTERKSIVEVICEMGKEDDDPREAFDFMTIDEVHLAKKLGGMYTTKVHELIDGIEGLYDEGYIASLSGDPTPNTPDDIVPQLRIYDRDSYGDVSSLRAAIRKLDPLVIRNALLDYMLLLDPEFDWEQYVDRKDVDLYEEERKIYQAILNNDELDLTEKRNMLYRCVLNPNYYVADGREVKSAYLDLMVESIVGKLETDNAVVIAEAHLKDGILRDSEDGRKSLATRVKERLGGGIRFHIIDGDNKNGERERAFADLEAAAAGTGPKTVVFGWKDIIGLGIDLSHVNQAKSTSSSFNMADDAQYVMRFPRGANTEATVTYMDVWDTVLEGYRLHAENKYEQTRILKYGGVLTEDDAALLEGGDMAENIRVERGKVLVGTAIVNSILSPRQKLNRIFAGLHAKGAEVYAKFLEDYGAMFAKLYKEVWTRSYGANNSRFVAGLWKSLEAAGELPAGAYLDAASGHLVLDSTLGALDDGRKRKVYSLDLNRHMLQLGEKEMEASRPGYTPNVKVGSISNMGKMYGDGQFAALNCSLAFNYTKLNTRITHVERDERVATLMEFNRVLKRGGVMMLTFPKNVGTREELLEFTRALEEHFGFKLMGDFSGKGVSTDNPDGSEFSNWVVTCKKVSEPSLSGLDLKRLQLSRVKVKSSTSDSLSPSSAGGEGVEGIIHNKFKLSGLDLEFEFGAESEEKREQRALMEKVDAARVRLRALRNKHGGLTAEKLPALEVHNLLKDDIKLIQFGANVFFQFMSLPPELQKPYSVD